MIQGRKKSGAQASRTVQHTCLFTHAHSTLTTTLQTVILSLRCFHGIPLSIWIASTSCYLVFQLSSLSLSLSPSLPPSFYFIHTLLVHTDTQFSLFWSHVDRDDSWNHSLTGWPSSTILSLSFRCLHLTQSVSTQLKSLPQGHSHSISISGCCAFLELIIIIT